MSETEQPSKAHVVLRQIFTGSAIISVLAVLLALIVGAVLIAATNSGVQESAGYFFSRPSDMLTAIWDSVSGAYSSLFQGSVYNFRRPGFENGIRPLTETLTFATPLIVGALGETRFGAFRAVSDWMGYLLLADFGLGSFHL